MSHDVYHMKEVNVCIYLVTDFSSVKNDMVCMNDLVLSVRAQVSENVEPVVSMLHIVLHTLLPLP